MSGKAADFTGSGRRLLAVLAPRRGKLSLLMTFGMASAALMAIAPTVLGDATDLIFTGAVRTGRGVDFAAVGRVLLIALGLYVLASLFARLQGMLTTTVVQRSMFELRERVEAKLARLPVGYFDRQPRGELLSRVTNDIDNLAQTLQQTMGQVLVAFWTTLGVFVLMVATSPLLTLAVLATVPLVLVVSVKVGGRVQPRLARQWAATGVLNGHVEEIYTAHAVVRAFGRQAEAKREFDEHNSGLHEAALRAQVLSGLVQPATTLISNLSYLLVAVIGALEVTAGALTLGQLQAFILYARQFTQSLSQIASLATLVQSAVASAERVFAVLDADEQSPDPAAPARPGRSRGLVEFHRVAFRYDLGTPLIDDLTLSVRPGQTVAIVGHTGAGKTTLLNLLMRFHEVDAGRITLDGVDITSMTRDDLRARTAMVPQDTWLFGGTIAANIAYGATAPTRADIVEAAKAAHVDHFCRTLPDGYDTVLDENGGNISAGQRQLVTVARAFLTDPAVLVLDEATSSVDTRTEVLVQAAMNRLRQGRTSFVIAHRLATVRAADLILVMADGRIVEQGTHAALLDTDGPYRRLHDAATAVTGPPAHGTGGYAEG
ncbi:ABC transporter ATP-binding protein [Kibdelosporangium lantanae]